MGRDWNSILHNRIRAEITRWMDESHENDPRLPAVILAEAIQKEIDHVEAEKQQWIDEMNSHYQTDSDAEPEFP